MAISVKRIKVSEGRCNCCHNEKEDAGALFEIHLRAPDRIQRIYLCEACVADLFTQCTNAKQMKGKRVLSADYTHTMYMRDTNGKGDDNAIFSSTGEAATVVFDKLVDRDKKGKGKKDEADDLPWETDETDEGTSWDEGEEQDETDDEASWDDGDDSDNTDSGWDDEGDETEGGESEDSGSDDTWDSEDEDSDSDEGEWGTEDESDEDESGVEDSEDGAWGEDESDDDGDESDSEGEWDESETDTEDDGDEASVDEEDDWDL